MDGTTSPAPKGIRRFALEVAELAESTSPGRWGRIRFIRQLGERYAYIRLQDVSKPLRFLRQMAGVPPVQLGTVGFRPDIVDDYNPARHYVAFVWLGFWLPYPLAILMIYGWEIAGFVRYRGMWSHKDVRGGLIGVRHGRQVRRWGPHVLPLLIVRELADSRHVDIDALIREIQSIAPLT